MHFADLTVAVLYDGPGDVRESRIFAEPARDARDAERRVAELSALFAFHGEWHATLSRYRYDLPTPDMLRRAA